MHKLAIGKRHEFLIWARLLQAEFDVFPSMVDDKGIDGIVGYRGKYFEIQIKSGENWANQRGFGEAGLRVNPERIYVVFNYTADEIRYFRADQILSEEAWQESIRWNIPQIKLPKALLEKYKDQDWDGFVRYLKGEQAR